MSAIGSIGSNLSASHTQVLKRAQEALQTEKDTQAFGERITNAIEQVATAQNKTAKLVKSYEMGMENDLSKVMINQQMSSLGFQLTLNVRNKVLSAYKDIMNMPV